MLPPLARTPSADRQLRPLVEAARERLVACVPEHRAVVLIGSLARGEGTVLPGPPAGLVLSDLDLAVVFDDEHARDAATPRLNALARELVRVLRPQGFLAAVDLGAYALSDLARQAPRPGTLEFRRAGRVLAGDPAVLDALPAFREDEIPAEEALLLCENRLLELLWVRPGLERPEPAPWVALYAGAKGVLDAALALLVARGRCPGGVEERRNAVREDIPEGDDEHEALLEGLAFWTRFKCEPAREAIERRYPDGGGEPVGPALGAWLEGARRLLETHRRLVAASVPGAAAERWWLASARRAPLRRRLRRWLDAWRERETRPLPGAGAAALAARSWGGTPEHRLGASAAALVAAAPGMNGDPERRARAALDAARLSPVPSAAGAAWEEQRAALVRAWDHWVLRGTRTGEREAPWELP